MIYESDKNIYIWTEFLNGCQHSLWTVIRHSLALLVFRCHVIVWDRNLQATVFLKERKLILVKRYMSALRWACKEKANRYSRSVSQHTEGTKRWQTGRSYLFWMRAITCEYVFPRILSPFTFTSRSPVNTAQFYHCVCVISHKL